MTKERLAALVRLFRPDLSMTAGICVVLGELLALGHFPPVRLALLGFLSFFCISATALIFNDYLDVETDRINAPHRPIPSGRVSPREALGLSLAVALAGLGFSLFISGTAFLIAGGVWIVGLLYNWRLKKAGLVGNLFVGFSVAMTFLYGGIIVGHPFQPVVWYLAATTFFVDLAEEIAADALDVEGDRRTGSRSLAVRYGPQRAMRISFGLFAVVVLGSAAPFLFGWLEYLYVIPILFLDIMIAVSAVRLLDHRRPDRIRDIRRIYLSGLATFLAIIVIRLVAPAAGG